MKISTRGRYALRVMVDLAEHAADGYIPMKTIAQRQGISLKYLEQIVPVLSQRELLKGIHGKGGGYTLGRSPETITVGEILRLTEGDLAPVACLECGARPCVRRDTCRTLSVWKGLYQLIGNYLDNISIKDLMQEDSCLVLNGTGSDLANRDENDE